MRLSIVVAQEKLQIAQNKCKNKIYIRREKTHNNVIKSGLGIIQQANYHKISLEKNVPVKHEILILLL